MAFPATRLDMLVEIALGADLTADPSTWTWTDVSSYVLVDQLVVITRGRPDQYSTVPPATCQLTVRNTDGRWCRTNPTGAWYGQLAKNTPLRVRVNGGSGYVSRFVGYIDALPPRWDTSQRYVTVPLTATGVLRRISNGAALRSALYRAHTGGYYSSGTALAYWPMEDASGSTSFASAVGGRPMTFGGPNWSIASDSTIAGSEPLPKIGDSGSFFGQVGVSTGATSWAMRWVMKIPAGCAGQLLNWSTPAGGNALAWWLSLDGGTDVVHIAAFNAAGTDIIADVGTTITGIRDKQLYIEVNATQNGTGINWSYNIWFPTGTGSGSTGTLASSTVASVADVHLWSGTAALGSTTIGHIAVSSDTAFGASSFGANGYAGEATFARFLRILAEENIPWDRSNNALAVMGPQPTATLAAQLQEIAATENAPIYDSLTGYLYLAARSDRYNSTVALTLSFTAGQVLPPQTADDDQELRNDVVVTNRSGSSARSTKKTGSNSITSGTYTASISVNARYDDALQGYADWLRAVGTQDDLRWPQISFNLHRTTSKILTWLACDIGSRIQISSPMSQLAPDTIDLILEGYTERLGPKLWAVDMNCSAAAPYQVFTVEGSGNSGRLDTAGSTLVAAASAVATSFSAVTSTGPLWSTTSVPYDLEVGGERVTATAVANAVTDAFGRTASSGWGPADSGQSWVVGAGTASLFSATGSVGQIAVSALNTEHHIALDVGYALQQRVRTYLTVGVTPTGAVINWGVMLRRADASNLYWIDVQVGTTGSLTLRVISKIAATNTQLTTATSATVHSTSVARILLAEIDAANVIRAKVWADGATEPDWELVYNASAVVGLSAGTSVGCIARLATGNTNAAPVNFQFDTFAVLNPQTLTVTRAVNAVSKAQTSGTAVRLWRPGVIAL